ncbi:hypothetical protein ACFODZ_10020 [Marinicella sediminis]|uniref:Uncharacterized protein n=1 Tax=Marinicella sediminis TaxID=1792834 RepID=A0ABV7JEQ7_9GAMM|nr:hypothetical protein [Marinicella sediminis]
MKHNTYNITKICALLAFCGLVNAQQDKSFQPFEIAVGKMAVNTIDPIQMPSSDSPLTYQGSVLNGTSQFDFLQDRDRGYQVSKNQQGLFGEELVMGMKFADWLTLRLSVIDEDQPFNLFNGQPVNANPSSDDLMGYQFGVSSVLNLSQNWRFGIDLGMGKVGGDILGLYEDQVETTRLGFGVRNQKFGATFQSDFMNSKSSNQIDQSTIDLQVDWHFTKDGTLSFGARRNITDSATNGASIDELTGTVPYIKFKHNL